MTAKTVTMYTRDRCNFCHMAKMLFRNLHVTPTEHNVEANPLKKSEMERRVPEGKHRFLPHIFIGGHYVGGWHELNTLHQQGTLKLLLGIA